MSFKPSSSILVCPSLFLSLSPMAISLRHVVFQSCIPHPIIPISSVLDSYTIPTLISPCIFAKLHHWAVTQSCLEFSSFVYNFQPACIGCLLLVMYNAKAWSWHAYLQPSWPMLFPVSGMIISIHLHFFMFKFIQSFFKAQFTALLEVCPQNLWLEVISSAANFLLF